MPKDQEVLETILKAIVRKPEEVEVERSTDDMGVFLRVRVAREDMGLVIGEQGKNIGAVRMVMKLVGLASQARVNIKLEEPLGARPDVAQRSETTAL